MEFVKLESGFYEIKFLGGYKGVAIKNSKDWYFRLEQCSGPVEYGVLPTLKMCKSHIMNIAQKYKTKVKSGANGNDVWIPITTPWSCNPASESYWSA